MIEDVRISMILLDRGVEQYRDRGRMNERKIN